MTVANELSTDIASAILAATKESPRRLEELKEIVLLVHSTLQEMAEKKEQTKGSQRQDGQDGQ
jgi:hypothetical protein